MKVVCIGGGPAGLYCAISMKLRDPAHEVLVVERNRPDDTFGWGVVFSNETLDKLWHNDPDSAAAIEASFQHWDDIDCTSKGTSSAPAATASPGSRASACSTFSRSGRARSA
jgi:anthraniloyl-CoA monooxygenase